MLSPANKFGQDLENDYDLVEQWIISYWDNVKVITPVMCEICLLL